MKKYICPNCGFKTRFQTSKKGNARLCNNCKTQVYSSETVLASMMMFDIQRGKRVVVFDYNYPTQTYEQRR